MGITPSPQEKVLGSMLDRMYEPVINDVLDGLGQGKSPGLLAIARPDLAEGFAEAWQRLDGTDAPKAPEPNSYKSALFEEAEAMAEEGDPAAIGSLFKFAESAGQVATATALLLDYKDEVAEWRTDRAYVQFIGSFNPQHIGHRTTVRSALKAAGGKSDVALQVVDSHPIKQDLPPYEPRYKEGERRLYQSPLIDNNRVTPLDVPAGNGLARDGAAQIELIANAAGDNQLRWLVGSDKFMTDVESARMGKETARAITRFKHPRMQLYVARREDHDPSELHEAADYIRETFGTGITHVSEAPNRGVLAAAASKIRLLRAAGRHQEADRMETLDLRLKSSES